jgi:hypothetical protein
LSLNFDEVVMRLASLLSTVGLSLTLAACGGSLRFEGEPLEREVDKGTSSQASFKLNATGVYSGRYVIKSNVPPTSGVTVTLSTTLVLADPTAEVSAAMQVAATATNPYVIVQIIATGEESPEDNALTSVTLRIR